VSEGQWQTIKVCFCDHIKEPVSFEALVVYASEIQPDQPARVLAHRCARGAECCQDDRPACLWAGTNPAVDPFEV